MSPQEIKDLRIEVRTLLARHELDRKGSIPTLLQMLKIHNMHTIPQTLSMAITGYRSTAMYVAILNKLKEILLSGEFIHTANPKDN